MFIEDTPIDELLQDLIDSAKDVAICEIAAANGIKEYIRLESNNNIIGVISNEIKRRLLSK